MPPSADDRDHRDDDRLMALRREYRRGGLRRDQLDADPIEQLQRWLEQAIAARLPEPTAMILATAGAAGRPAARTVLLKGLDADGLRFFTNYQSRKGRELAANPHAAVCFLWPGLERQARAEGVVERLSAEDSAAYFGSRPRASQLGAWASPQSAVVADRAALEARLRDTEARFAGAPVPLPPTWGGFLLRPRQIELWQGRPGRLHDRFRYTAEGPALPPAAWRIERLAP